ncbi:MAG: baseplate J/gp47 family protein [Treponema sp.]|jgi:uncharacterized phage protein gp47/JayE|nr:baseplate J/gp47 family protein [Treponema sp.]
MSFKRDSLTVLRDRTYANYMSLYRPLDKTPRHNLLKVLASVDAGINHQLLGDLDFLAKQIFPDTAEGEHLRSHWSSRVAPLYAVAATGTISVPGVPGAVLPAGLVYTAPSGQHYFTEMSFRVGSDGFAAAAVRAETFGAEANLAAGETLSLSSSIPPGVDSTAAVTGDGITGGADAESDEAYLVRVLQAIRNPVRYGKPGDFADWAADSSPEVSRAWEFRNFGVFGAVLILVTGGNQIDGIVPVGSLALITSYISEVAPPVLFTVRTPALIPLEPAIALLPAENTTSNRTAVTGRLKQYLQTAAAPGMACTAGMLREVIIDGVTISDAAVKLNGSESGQVTTTILELPVLGDITWE